MYELALKESHVLLYFLYYEFKLLINLKIILESVENSWNSGHDTTIFVSVLWYKKFIYLKFIIEFLFKINFRKTDLKQTCICVLIWELSQMLGLYHSVYVCLEGGVKL